MFSSLKEKFRKFTSLITKKGEEKKEDEEGKDKEKIKEEEIKKEEIEIKEEKKEEKVKLSMITKIKGIFSKNIKLSQDDIKQSIDDLRYNLIEADVAYDTANKICDKLAERLKDKEIEKDKIEKFVNEKIREVLLEVFFENKKFFDYIKNFNKPIKIVFFGINGTGKTTTIAKLGNFLLKNNKSVVFAAGDTFRAGAIEQLETHANKLNIKIIKPNKRGADAAAVIYDAVEYSKAHYIDFVLADTAGRMQTNKALMEEMKKIVRVIKPDLKILVADGFTGNDAVEQAKEFNNAVGIDGVIITKMDTAKGGCAFSIVDITQKPIFFIGTGQSYEDIMEFDKEWFVDEILK